MSKRFRQGIVPVEILIGCNPEFPGLIREQSVDENSAQAVRLFPVRAEGAKSIAIVAPQSVFGSKPQKPRMILDDVTNAAVGRSLSERRGNEEKIRSF